MTRVAAQRLVRVKFADLPVNMHCQEVKPNLLYYVVFRVSIVKCTSSYSRIKTVVIELDQLVRARVVLLIAR
jgi:hypothetical protein